MGMIPRGEVGLIFARIGLASGVFDAGLFGATTLMVMVTTLVAPPCLKRLLEKTGAAARAFDVTRGDRGPGHRGVTERPVLSPCPYHRSHRRLLQVKPVEAVWAQRDRIRPVGDRGKSRPSGHLDGSHPGVGPQVHLDGLREA